MADNDKDILIVPNKGQPDDPKIEFKGADASTGAQTITLNVYPTDNGTLSFEGSAGQLFSITNDLSGTIFSVNDVSGIPSIEVFDDGTVKLAEFGGNVEISKTINLYREIATSQIGDTFAGATDKSYIYFTQASGNNDPGYIMHETSSTETNEGVLHLVPTDDNSYGDYVSIHGTNDPDSIKLHTDGTIDTGSGYALKLSSGTGEIQIPIDGENAINFTANDTNDNRGIAFNGRIALSADYNDGWMRLNNRSEFSNGTYSPLKIESNQDMRAPIFYDRNDTNYYIDPASQSHLNTLTLQGNRIGFINSSFDAEIRVSDSNPDGTGAIFEFWGDGSQNNATLYAEIFQGTVSIRSPIFYDRNNTAYRVDAASTSVMNTIDLEGTIRHNGDTNTYIQFHAADQFRVVTGGSENLEVNNSYVLANDQLRTPLIYDSNNTGYYVNPASTTKLNDLEVNSLTVGGSPVASPPLFSLF